MADHSTRDHAKWSASATAANVACAGRLALIEHFAPPDEESEAAAWGTACHQVSEKCLRGGKDAAEFIGTTETTKKHSFEVDEEMAETAQMYVDFVRGQMRRYGEETGGDNPVHWIEQNFSLASLDPPLEAGGTGDCVIWYPAWRQLEIVDLKGGRGVVVEAKGNQQLRTYGLGAVLAHPELPVETVVVTIVQPRAAHKDGRIRSEEFHVVDLIEWTSDLLDSMRRSADAIAEIGTEAMAGWAAKWLTPGDHCDKSFCPVRAQCPALHQKVIDSAGVWFDAAEEPRLSKTPDELNPARLAQMLDMADMIESWIDAVRARAHSLAESGVDIPNYVLVDKEGREKWNDGAEEAVKAAARDAGLPEAKFLNAPKLRTPKQVRDALFKAGHGTVADTLKSLSSTPRTGTNLCRADKTSRPTAIPAAVRFLDQP